MPRPGPRPYECVKKSWHSDRHQGIRGSIIQQILKVAQENHSSSTKNNREWQAKLPVVVFKSEEIMYSKANSEAEYLDHDTLWDRLNDAINTIIRKDETMETGEFLPPCVEAALNLGCIPVKSSRSQRNSNTRSYLGSRNQDSSFAPPKTMSPAISSRNLNLPNVERPNAVNQTQTFSDASRDVRQNYKVTPPGSSFYPPSFERFPKPNVSAESRASLGASSVYPLYHGVNFQPQAPQLGFHGTHQNSNAIIVGTPVFQAPHEPLPFSQKGCSEKLFLFDRDDNGLKKTIQDEPQPALVECDLSLRLGRVSSSEKGLTFVNDADTGPSKEFSFFPLNSEAEKAANLAADVRKRGQCVVQSEPNERMKRRGV